MGLFDKLFGSKENKSVEVEFMHRSLARSLILKMFPMWFSLKKLLVMVLLFVLLVTKSLHQWMV